MQPDNFAEWLQTELNSRAWDQHDLARRSGLTNGAISHVLNGTRQAGVDFCIAIARALGIPRHEVFRLRGWLLDQAITVLPADADPRLVRLSELVQALSPAHRELVLDAWEATLKAAGLYTSP